MHEYRTLKVGVLRLTDNKVLTVSDTDPDWILYEQESNNGAIIHPEQKDEVVYVKPPNTYNTEDALAAQEERDFLRMAKIDPVSALMKKGGFL